MVLEGALSSGVIYAAIVVMWAVVLVPMFLHRHDARSETRSVDSFHRFADVMRSVSRRAAPTPDKRYVVMPPRQVEPNWHVSGASAPSGYREIRVPGLASCRRALGWARRRLLHRPPGPSRARLMARRRRRLAGLSAAVLLTLVLASVGVASWVVQLVVDVALLGYLWHLRAVAKRAAASSAPVVRGAAATRAPATTYRAGGGRRMRSGATADWRVAGEDVGRDSSECAVDADAPTGELPLPAAGWHPLPVPPPSYATGPPGPVAAATAPTGRDGLPSARPDVGMRRPSLFEDDDLLGSAEAQLDFDPLDAILDRRAVGD